MFGIRYCKVPPTTYILQYRSGKVVREGAGLSFFYYGPNSTIVQVPMASTDVPFVFNEVTADFQEATIQGALLYRIHDPRRVAAVLDFSLDFRGRYRSEDPEKLSERLIQAAQTRARGFTQRHSLADVLVSSDALVNEIREGLKVSDVVAMLGVEILDLSIASIKAMPEMSKALQAHTREELLRRADEAVHARRNAAIELERQIRENELKTEMLVQQKQRELQEAKMAADIALEEQRAGLVEQRVANQRQEAEARAHALRATIEPLKEVDWRTLMAASAGAADPKLLIAMAFRDLADNAGKIGRLDISPELLNTLLDSSEEK